MTQQLERTLPEIDSDEDEPITQNNDSEKSLGIENDPILRKGLEFPKFKLGSVILGWCTVLMFACVIISLFVAENELLKNAFEAFKLIVMTVLGYIFGSQTKA